jgi:hypothetical protein
MEYRALSGFIEKRNFTRTEVRWPATIITEEGLVEGEARNISVQGVFILFTHSMGHLAPTKTYRLLINPPGEKIIVIGKLVWSNLDILPGKGFCFVEITEGDRALLRKAIRKHAEK